MRDGWRHIPLGEVARLDVDRVSVDPMAEYVSAGVLNEGKGVFDRGVLHGNKTNYPVLHRLHAGQLVMRKLTAWEGPIAVVPPELAGHVVSPEFPTFTLDRSQLEPAFMSLLCSQPSLWHALRDRSTGSVQRRKRVSPKQLLAIRVLLPAIPDQRRIVDLFAMFDQQVLLTHVVLKRAAEFRLSFLENQIDAHPGQTHRWKRTTLGAVTDVVGGGTPSTENSGFWNGDILWITPTEVASQDGDTVLRTKRQITESGLASSGARLVPAGTVLVTSRATVGSVALAGVALAINQGFAALICHAEVSPEWLMLWCQAHREDFRVRAGGSTFPEVSRARVRQIPLTVPPWREQRETVSALDAVDRHRRAVAAVLETTVRCRRAVLEDLLSGRHAILDSYDRFLTASP